MQQYISRILSCFESCVKKSSREDYIIQRVQQNKISSFLALKFHFPKVERVEKGKNLILAKN